MIEDNITIKQGSRFEREWVWETPTVEEPDVDNDAHWTPVDLAGYTARMQVRNRAGGDIYLDLTDGDGIVLQPDDATGVVRVVLGASDTRLLTKGGKYDLELTPGDDSEGTITLSYGTVTLVKEITA